MEGTDWEKVLQSAYRWPHLKIDGWKQFEKEHPARARLERQEVIRPIAEKGKHYTLSDDLIAVITKLARCIDPLLLFEAAKNIRLPFGYLIYHVSGEALRRAYASGPNPVDVSNLTTGDMAFLIMEGSDTTKAVILANYEKDCVQPLALYPVTVALGPDDGIFAERLELMKLKQFNARLAQDGLLHSTHWLLGEFRIAKFPEAAKAIDQDPNIVPYVTNMSTFQHRFIYYENAAGTMCWFAALCYLMVQPTIVRYVDRIGAERSPSGRLRACEPQQASAITIFLPREKVITRMLRLASLGPRKQVGEHDVMGFWSLSHKRGDPDCKHAWPHEFSRRQVCALCNALRWWKEPHRRGHGPVRAVGERRLDYSGQDINALIARAGNVQAGT